MGNYAVLGLLLAQIMKFFDSIVKLFISGSSMYASAFLTVTIFKRVPSFKFCFGLFLVTVALLLYNYDKIKELVTKKRDTDLASSGQHHGQDTSRRKASRENSEDSK